MIDSPYRELWQYSKCTCGRPSTTHCRYQHYSTTTQLPTCRWALRCFTPSSGVCVCRHHQSKWRFHHQQASRAHPLPTGLIWWETNGDRYHPYSGRCGVALWRQILWWRLRRRILVNLIQSRRRSLLSPSLFSCVLETTGCLLYDSSPRSQSGSA